MLAELRIDNFAIINHLEVDFKSGLTTFTGETGAGKSILLDAIMAIVGGKVDAAAIRSGADRSLVEADFHIPEMNSKALMAVLNREELGDDPAFVTLSRELRREGRTVARINGHSVSLALLREVGDYLVDIHGQSEHLSLLNVRRHLGLLDRYAGSTELLDAYQQTYHQIQLLRRELTELRLAEQESARRLDLLNFQAEEIEAALLKPGEEEELRGERDRLANAENLAALTRQGLALLEEGSPEVPSISDMLGQATQALASVSRMDSAQVRLSDQAQSALEIVADLVRDLQDYQERIEFNPRRLEQLEDRLDLINRLKRKYGGSIEAVLAFGRDARQRLNRIANAGELIAGLEAQELALLKELALRAEKLSACRSRAAAEMGAGVERELADLSMAGARFQVSISSQPDPAGVEIKGQRLRFDEHGVDRVEFLIDPNPGEGFKPLVKIASGGETSRLMLALKNVLVQADEVPTLIFDEIDQGIGGRVGAVVGEKLWQLARAHQVLCVTHLPQLAAYGDQHYNVNKAVSGGRTQTQVVALSGEGRVNELAQMLGALNDANLKAARVGLEQAHLRVEELLAAQSKKGVL